MYARWVINFTQSRTCVQIILPIGDSALWNHVFLIKLSSDVHASSSSVGLAIWSHVWWANSAETYMWEDK